MRRFLPLIAAILLLILPTMLVTHSCANTTEAPSGGDKDTIPPYITDISPLPGAVGVPLEGMTFVFTFNEYVTIENPNNIFLSPPLGSTPKSRIKGKNLLVSFEEPLKPNTTYTLSFTDAIADVNEGNIFAGYTYAFSTGQKIDSMMITGTVRDCNTLEQVKGATVMLYKDFSDSAVFRSRPDAAIKTDDWGYFALPFIQDTLYRLYAVLDNNNDNIFDPETELVAFADSAVRPFQTASDTTREMLRYDMLDTLACQARFSEYELKLFREIPSRQLIKGRGRNSERSAYISFMAPYAMIDSLKIEGYRASQIITQFNLLRDSLEIWLNSRSAAPDTMKLELDYYKTDSLGDLSLQTENIRLALTNEMRTYSKRSRRELTESDTTCVLKVTATPETVEQNGIEFLFSYPIISEKFDSVRFTAITPRQTEIEQKFTLERDSLNLRRYILRPDGQLLTGYEYRLKVPYKAFRDINGYYSDSTEVSFSLPGDQNLSTLVTELVGVGTRYIVDLLNEKRDNTLRTYGVVSDTTLTFPYLKEGRYSIRITEDRNGNSYVDTGSVLEHRQPEKVMFYELEEQSYISVPAASEVVQTIDIAELFGTE